MNITKSFHSKTRTKIRLQTIQSIENAFATKEFQRNIQFTRENRNRCKNLLRSTPFTKTTEWTIVNKQPTRQPAIGKRTCSYLTCASLDFSHKLDQMLVGMTDFEMPVYQFHSSHSTLKRLNDNNQWLIRTADVYLLFWCVRAHLVYCVWPEPFWMNDLMFSLTISEPAYSVASSNRSGCLCINKFSLNVGWFNDRVFRSSLSSS